MQMIEAALAFAITMLVLSLICSAFVELIHRIFSMREAGLKHMLGQMFDQVLSKYISPSINAAVAVDNTISADTKSKRIGELLKEARKGFVERMSANRAPMGVQPNATPVDSTKDVEKNPSWRFGLRNGRDLSSLS